MEFLNKFAPHVHWALRLSLAATFLYHGWGKFPVEATAQAMGMPVAMVLAVGIAELAAGVLLLVGGASKEILTRIAAAIVIVIMLGAIFMVHLKNGFNVMNGGMEFQLLMLATGLYFLAKGNRA